MIWFFDFKAQREAKRAARKDVLRQALVGYPLYDPPHKVEERRLPPDKAQENFDYFMNVRSQRLTAFREWAESKFGVRLALDRTGVAALCDWSGLYGEFLFETRDDLESYYYYTKPWLGDCIGSNVVFDMATFMGEALIAQCPKLFWDVSPFIFPYDARLVLTLKKDKGSGFQRPTVTGFRNPLMNWDTFLEIGNYILKFILSRTIPNLIEEKKKITDRRWNEDQVRLELRSFDAKIVEYKDKRTLPLGMSPRDGYDE